MKDVTPIQDLPCPLILLVGGLGTRLHTVSKGTPKALVNVKGRPFLEWQLSWLRQQGVQHVHLATGHQSATFLDWTESYRADDLPTLTLSVESEPLGTGGGLAYAWEQCTSDRVLVANGDSLMPGLSLVDFYNKHRSHPQAVQASIVVTRVENTGRFGTIEFDLNRCVTAFLEKQSGHTGWVNGGFYVMDAAAKRAFPKTTTFSLERDVFPTLAAQKKLGVCVSDAELLDMGTPEGLQELTDYLENSST